MKTLDSSVLTNLKLWRKPLGHSTWNMMFGWGGNFSEAFPAKHATGMSLLDSRSDSDALSSCMAFGQMIGKRANKKAVYPSIYRNFRYFRLFFGGTFRFLGWILLIIQGSFNLIIWGESKHANVGFPLNCALFALGVMACVIVNNSGKPPENPCNPAMFRLFVVESHPRSWPHSLTSGQGGVNMVKGSDPFWELGKLRVGVAEIEMIPSVDGGSRNLGRNPPFGCIEPP